MLWIELFDSHLDNELPNFADMKYKMDMFPRTDRDAKPKIEAVPTGQKAPYGTDAFKIPQQPASSPFLLYIGEIGNEVKKSLAQQGMNTGATEIAAECKRRWQTMGEDEKIVCKNRSGISSELDANDCRNGTCYTPRLWPSTATRSNNPAFTRK
jgi:hypothetical protein